MQQSAAPDRTSAAAARWPAADAIVATNLAGFYSGGGERRVQQNTAAGALFTIHEGYVRPGQIFDATERFRIPARDDNALLPNSEGDYSHGVAAKQPADLRGIRFAALPRRGGGCRQRERSLLSKARAPPSCFG